MCGIAGIHHPTRGASVPKLYLEAMAAVLRHRGPDGFGFYRDEHVGLAHTRLSIIDLEGGWQPIHNEDRSVWIVFNGEIFNYVELRAALEKQGHVFSTKSDTEVIVHLYEQYGTACLSYLNGQFAFAIWDAKNRRLFLARDRVGIRPLYYAMVGDELLFASEIKALFTDPRLPREIDPNALDQIFTFWMTVPPCTAFRGISELEPGHFMVVENGQRRIQRYWDPDFTPDLPRRSDEDYADELLALLVDATRIQLRADVPVGAYLSGGIDSSAITALIKHYTDTPLRTFSVTFADKDFDETAYQQQVVNHLGTDHSSISCTYEDIGDAFPDVVWAMEKPVLRTAPTPLFLLSGLVRESGYKVVLTGEGADEILAGYDLFKEAKVRRFIEKNPGSKFRPLLLKRLYPYLATSPIKASRYAETFFAPVSTDYPPHCYAHVPRWSTTTKAKQFFSPSLRERVAGHDSLRDLAALVPGHISSYDHLSQAQYLEIKTLLSGYLLSSQGDRVAMAHSIEGRYPFLDHRVMEFCFRLPPTVRMRGLTEKYLLKMCLGDRLPKSVIRRTKQPYRAPDAKSFFGGKRHAYVEDLLSESALTRTGYFDPKAVGMLAAKCARSPVLGFKDNMAIVGVISTQLLHDRFIDRYDNTLREQITAAKGMRHYEPAEN
ncbi:MAG: asparagine synthase (glutamine-hydrolyzing) [Candidatus Geothermincolia bacterium]